MKHLNFIKISAFCGIIFPILSFAFIILLGYLTPGYSFMEDYISEIWATGSRFEGIALILLILIGFMSFMFSIGLYLAIGEDKFSFYNLVLLVVFSFSLVFLGIFPCKETCSGQGFTMHSLFTIIACASLGFSPLLLYFVTKKDKKWKNFEKDNLVFFFFSAFFLVLYGLLHNEYKGFYQRTYFFICFLWIERISIKLFKLSKKQRRKH